MSMGHFPPLDYDFHPAELTVPPEHRLRLSYDKKVLGLDGRCHLELDLPSGEKIQSQDFGP